ncbi:JAB domain-containing protein [Paenibacillus sp. GP183]|jgi:DNA repair protein RadC|uniref:JAB domain-containing protein n=1 Tax=Paenibacillus sp. GP183 TaxID=1882751 RepID=UPI0008978C83|nr:JAB domain-containing protein [Paenibacillus sp. GP183]SED10409.1 DNA repair protein RadC [Paenibacillus sp. GP183]
MFKVNIYSIKQVKEKAGLYDLQSKVIRSPKDVHELVEKVLDLSNEASELFGIITLNTKNVIAGMHILSKGSLNSSLVHPREVFKAAILNNAASLICFHNHPSGDCSPSPEDIQLTGRLVEVGSVIGIEVLDHVIVGNDFCSLKEKGFM